jgi:hypothetical protein
MQMSANLSASERARGALAAARGGHPSLVAEFTPQPLPEPEAFDMAFALRSAREAAHAAEDHRSRAEEYQRRLNAHPDDANMASSVEQHRREAERYDGIVERWDDLIMANRED